LVDADCNNLGYCMTNPTVACATNDDCAVDGFCYGGLCTPAAVPGHCEYASAGFCQGMGSCASTGLICDPDTGTNCCDYDCVPARTCPGGAADCVGKADCDAVPGGADCAFCEGCDPWPNVACSNLGGSGECPSPGAGLPAGTCVANPLYVCNGDADCPEGASGGLCVFPAVGPGGRLCRSHEECVIPATVCGPEHTGACCDGDTGLCAEDQLEANCKGGQLHWSKLTSCANAACVRHTGACCDGTPKAPHCTIGYPEDCVGANQSWIKFASCDPDPCPALTLGSCCLLLSGECFDDYTAAECSAIDAVLQPNFSLDRTCLNIGCAPELGACCDHDTFGGCNDTIFAGCQGGKLEWIKGASCANIDCLHEAIPTVSEWGLVVLTLLLLTGAKVYFGRRQNATA
jgi:hypothetical protein